MEEEIAQNEGIRERLRYLLKDHAPVEIARKTGVLRSNVNRYLKGTKIPAEFCSSLVYALGVNPTWLLTGEGAPYLNEVTSDTASTATNLLELTQSMNAVMKMRLGSLAGKDHLKAVRALSENLTTYNRLRDRLNDQVQPLFRDLLDDFKRAMVAGKLDSALKIRQAAEQVAPLCNDENLLIIFYQGQALVENALGNWNLFLDYQRKVFHHKVADGEPLDDSGLEAAEGLIVALCSTHRLREAQRSCKAALAMIDEGPYYRYSYLQFCLGITELLMDQPNTGLARMQKYFKLLAPHGKATSRPLLVRGLLLTGMMKPVEAVASLNEKHPDLSDADMSSMLHNQASAILPHLCWLEDLSLLQKVWRRFSKDAGMMNCIAEWLKDYAVALTEVDKQSGTEIARDFDRQCGKRRSPATQGPVNATLAVIHSCDIARREGDTEFALEQLKKSVIMLENMPPEFTPPVLQRAIHHRNALLLIPAKTRSAGQKKLRAGAQLFFNHKVAAGYECLVGYSERVSMPQPD